MTADQRYLCFSLDKLFSPAESPLSPPLGASSCWGGQACRWEGVQKLRMATWRRPRYTPAMHPMLVLNLRQRGPDRERNISGICSTCGDTLLERLDAGDATPNPEFLRAKLDRVFEQHVADNHSQASTSVH